MITNDRGIGLVSGPVYSIIKIKDSSWQVRHTLEGNKVFRMEAHWHSLVEYATSIILGSDLRGNSLTESGTQVIQILVEYH